MKGSIDLHIGHAFLLKSAPRGDRGLLNLLWFGLAPKFVQVGLLWRRGFGSFGHVKESA